MEGTDGPGSSSPSAAWLIAVASGLLALVVRWSLVGGRTGLYGYHGYDDGVYFSSAIAFVHGQMPYRDFLLLHPPGIMLALAPFAAVARWTTDSTALAAARVAFILVGGLNTVLVSRLARRWGTLAAATAGILYAVSAAAAYAERLTLLEPLGTLTLLAAVSMLLRARSARSPRWWLLAGGAVLGLGPAVKIWEAVPVLVVLAWLGLTQGRRAALVGASGAVASAAVVVVPFALTAPAEMLRLVVLDQLGRARAPGPFATRLDGIVGMSPDVLPDAAVGRGLLLAAAVVAVTAAAGVAWVRHRGRLWVALLAAQVAVILAAPSYFDHYAAYSAAALALVVAAAISTLPATAGVSVAAVACLALAVMTVVGRAPHAPAFPAAEVRRLLPTQGCIRADSPGALALLDVLSRDVERGCDIRVDVSGETYDVGSRDARGRHVPRTRNLRWQHDAVAYLTSGSAAVLVRGEGDGLAPASVRHLYRDMTVVRLPGVRVLLPARPPPAP